MDNKIIKIDYTKDPYIAKECNGFISPDGKFYIVSKKSCHHPTHEEWASAFVLSNTNYLSDIQNTNGSLLYTISKLTEKQDILIHIYGYVYFSYSGEYSTEPIIIFPDEKINDKKVSIEQKNILFDIAKINGEDSICYFDCEKSFEENKHDSYVQRFIARRVIEEQKK